MLYDRPASSTTQKLGDWREVGLPYGAKPRLLLHACTEAVQSGSPEIAIGTA